ncbi:MAG: bifunctional folylpolyglutamate synthase/dihydrofolate synthase [Verrucomicrobia bacterium]|nr:bifunctional folylpolyglutamate synthase/dihydrofolate synthase [Verrucomicrobiota bacterium]
MKNLLRRLRHPEEGLNFIHIAGTNGKGSVAAALDSIFREAGFRPGLYTSPHLVDFRERIRVGGKMVGTRVLQKNLEGLIRVLKKIPPKERPTFFEATTALALQIFRQERVDFVVWETGLGGRLDATNVILPELCLLTSLGRDHEEILGRGWKKIGREKAGILKKGVPVFSVPWPAAAARILRTRARKLRCPLRVVRRLPAGVGRPGFHGPHQRWNLSLAREAGRYLGFPETWIRRGLAKASWPGRFQILESSPRLVLDGGHNPEGVRAALRAWRDQFGAYPGRIIFGCLKDKPACEMLREMKRAGAKIWGVNLPDPRGADPLRWPIFPQRLFYRVQDALEADRAEPVLQGTLVMGSLVLAGEVLRVRGWRPV